MLTKSKVDQYKKYINTYLKKYGNIRDGENIPQKEKTKRVKYGKILNKISNDLMDYLDTKTTDEDFNKPEIKEIYSQINKHDLITKEEVDKALGSESSTNISLKDKAKNKFKDVKPKILNRILNLIDDGTIKTEKDLDNIKFNKTKKKQPEPESDEKVVPVKKVGRPRKNPPSEPKEKR